MVFPDFQNAKAAQSGGVAECQVQGMPSAAEVRSSLQIQQFTWLYVPAKRSAQPRKVLAEAKPRKLGMKSEMFKQGDYSPILTI